MMACKLDITLPLLYYAFKPPSKREVNKWLASYKSTSVLALSPQASSKSPSILTLSPQDSSKSPSVLTLSPQSQSSPIPSPSGGAAADDLDQPCEYLKLQEKNILEKQNKLKEIEIPALLPKKKSRRKRTKPKAADVVPRKSARLASRLNQDQDQEAADPPAAVNQEAAVSPAGGQEAAESPAGGQEAAAADSAAGGQEAADPPAVDQEAAVSAAAGGHKSTKSPAGGQEAGALCALSLVADYSSDSGQE